MKTNLSPAARMSKHLFALLEGQETTDELLTDLMRHGMRHLVQEHLEAEQAEHLGRARYEHSEQSAGYRNGYYPKTLKTTVGRIQVEVPRVRDCAEAFESALLARLDTLEERMEQLVLEMYTRGLSTRDIEETLVDEKGDPLLSRSSVSRLTEALYAEYEAFADRDLADYDVAYLFVDGVYEAVRRYTQGQAILAAWAILADGRKVLLHLEVAASESTEAWSDFFEAMKGRGLRHPLLVVSDGNGGLKAAITRCFPKSERARCVVHKLRNLAAKVPQHVRRQILEAAKQVYYASDRESADLLAERFIAAYGASYPAMVKCFNDDLDACLVHLGYPLGHRRYIRSTNLLERAFVEEKRRTKIIPAHMHERGAMKLVYATLIRASRHWNRVSMTDLELAQLSTLRNTICPNAEQPETISFRLAA